MQREKKSTMSFESGKILYLSPNAIRPNPAQPRKVFSDADLQELAESIRAHGILQPLSVRRAQDGYELIAGERRLRAAKSIGLERLPCLVVQVNDSESSMLALIENLQRKDLDYIEQAEGIARLLRLYSISQEAAAAQLGKSQSAIANKLRLLQHSPAVRTSLRENGLSERQARALLRLSSDGEKLDAIRHIVKYGLNAAKTDAYISHLLEEKQAKRGMRKFVLRDVRLFLNSVNHNLELIKSAGYRASTRREETDDLIVLTITIPKKAG